MNMEDETGPTVNSPYPRRLESLTVCGCYYEDSTFSSVIFKTQSIGPAGIELITCMQPTARMAAHCSIN